MIQSASPTNPSGRRACQGPPSYPPATYAYVHNSHIAEASGEYTHDPGRRYVNPEQEREVGTALERLKRNGDEQTGVRHYLSPIVRDDVFSRDKLIISRSSSDNGRLASSHHGN